jgi:hypothetical protein
VLLFVPAAADPGHGRNDSSEPAEDAVHPVPAPLPQQVHSHHYDASPSWVDRTAGLQVGHRKQQHADSSSIGRSWGCGGSDSCGGSGSVTEASGAVA